MPEYLLASAWEKIAKEHQPASDAAPLAKLLEGYGKLKDEEDAEDQNVALTKINELALSAKRKFKDAKIAGYLDKLLKEIQAKKKEV